jgi:hypothetical protein
VGAERGARARSLRPPERVSARPRSVGLRVDALDWDRVEQSLWEFGYAHTQVVLTPGECDALVGLYDQDALFRNTVEMRRHGFGEGDYKYFKAPLPERVAELREALYPRLAPIANRWKEALAEAARFPPTLAEFLTVCVARGQTKPTPLLLHYEAGGYNCLHQDIYGEVAFPLQVAAFLSRPGVDYTGGEFLLVEQRPRAQSRGEALTPAQGELVIFTTRERPARGRRGFHRVNLRHGVSRIRTGRRYTLGVIFHEGK